VNPTSGSFRRDRSAHRLARGGNPSCESRAQQGARNAHVSTRALIRYTPRTVHDVAVDTPRVWGNGALDHRLASFFGGDCRRSTQFAPQLRVLRCTEGLSSA
jgi:hypothetical protein